MRRFVEIGLISLLSCVVAFGEGAGQSKGKGKGRKPQLMGARFFDSYARALSTGDGGHYPWTDITGTSDVNARGEREIDGESVSARCDNYDISTAAGSSSFNIVTVRLSFYLRVRVAFPLTVDVLELFDSSDNSKATLTLTNARNLRLLDSAGTQLGIGSTVLSLATEYRVDLMIGTGVSASYEVRVHQDGNPGTSVELSGTGDLGTGNFAYFTTAQGNLIRHSISHVALDDSGYLADGSDYRIESIFADGAGNDTAWTGTFADVDDVDHDGTSTEITSNTNLQRESVTLEDLPVLAVGETVIAVMNVYHMRKDVAAAVSMQVTDRSGGTDRDSANFTLDQNTNDVDQIWSVIYTTKPGGGSYTESDVNAYEIGVEHNQAQTRSAFCTAMNCNVLIEMPAPTGISHLIRRGGLAGNYGGRVGAGGGLVR